MVLAPGESEKHREERFRVDLSGSGHSEPCEVSEAVARGLVNAAKARVDQRIITGGYVCHSVVPAAPRAP